MMNKNKKTITAFLLTISLLIFIYLIQSSNGVKFVIRDIHANFKGKIINKYTVRKGISPTHLKVKTMDSEIEINPSYIIVDYANIGDSIIKPKDDNVCIIIKSNGVRKKFFYTGITKEQREDSKFPKEWKNKWMESNDFGK